MTYDTYWTDAGCVLRIGGDVDISCAPTLRSLERKLDATRNIVVDVAAMRYADTTFLRFLLRLREQVNHAADGSLRLTGVSTQLRRVLEITGLSRYFRE